MDRAPPSVDPLIRSRVTHGEPWKVRSVRSRAYIRPYGPSGLFALHSLLAAPRSTPTCLAASRPLPLPRNTAASRPRSPGTCACTSSRICMPSPGQRARCYCRHRRRRLRPPCSSPALAGCWTSSAAPSTVPRHWLPTPRRDGSIPARAVSLNALKGALVDTAKLLAMLGPQGPKDVTPEQIDRSALADLFASADVDTKSAILERLLP